ncbi:transporter substrate-binding domain-containing protein [Shewanella eurypsychrophilus]|uniref:Transporter substrate-binding domain-containing protein n=1 Tax=Shewanella eurypsychrophilus TaxID=2593656 RepID=A0ABX6V906_9GAMM|nr:MULTISPECIES: transporter substrate-binding domain-containing protein [Shewanella]QFU23918.1 transporter substrate-binding domain-containing protein [Shewanella sp. YLB-09]QPG59136.1 transporter substrate-binding domain-containing protein [Shewanella eurypsychrophilus]
MKFKSRLLVLITLLTLLLIPTYLSSAEPPLSIAFVEYPPYHFTQDENVEGISIRIIEEAFRRIDTPIEFKAIPWSRALNWLKTGQIDVMVGVFRTAEREVYIDYSNMPLSKAQIHLFVTEGADIKYSEDLTLLSHLSFGVKKDFSYGPYFDDLVAQKKLTKLNVDVGIPQLLVKLCTGVTDIVVGERRNTEYVFNQLSKQTYPQLERCKQIIALTPAIDARLAYLAFSKQNQLNYIRVQFDEAMKSMKQDGSLHRIIESYQPHSLSKNTASH